MVVAVSNFHSTGEALLSLALAAAYLGQFVGWSCLIVGYIQWRSGHWAPKPGKGGFGSLGYTIYQPRVFKFGAWIFGISLAATCIILHLQGVLYPR